MVIQKHPRVEVRDKTPEEVYNDFKIAMGGRVRNGVITEEDFISYYLDVNATLGSDKDQYFIDLIMNTWNLYSSKSYIKPSRLEQIKEIVFEKIRQRTHGPESAGKTIARLFKFFDLNNNGAITIDEFEKVLDTLGCLFKAHEIQALFNAFDKDSNGKINTEEFAHFMAEMDSGKNPNVPPQHAQTQVPCEVLAKIKKTLIARGANGIRGLGIVFRRMDDSRDRKLDRYEFSFGIKENGHDLTPMEMERLFKYFDRNNDGVIHYDEFLRGLRGIKGFLVFF